MYLDASNKNDFIEHFRQVFNRFRQFKITLNPDKAFIGYKEVEYVGHLINEGDNSFSKDKINNAIELERPRVKHEIKTALRIFNYFRSNLKPMANIVKSLEISVQNYTKNTLRTDHKHLTFINEGGSDKALQEFNLFIF